ncbi:hypothetical protein HHL22_05275 [Hymenobacter sp. RP-2-7]|uniref:Outer membrane protein beta-barrel domain-containing protein n=1 Tax=Hymenobacter polaris TaxID=2682546 RepID=A0A7Y0AC38_9BACT|nr:hypothetical protein [Hymenobacter polaris]NML64612.1 hypothetical protein [Hymenobacter polaris]
MRYLLLLALGGAALLAPGLAQAQEKPVLNTAPTVPQPTPVAPAPTRPAPAAADTSNVAPTIPVYTPGQAPAPAATPAPAAPAGALPAPTYGSPSGFDLPERERKRQALQQHAEQYTKTFVYTGLGLGYSSYYGVSQFSFSISPAIGYRVNDKFSIGPGISYAYNNYGFPTSLNTTQHISASNFGVKVFAQYMVYKQFFVHAEYESTRAELLAQDINGNLTGGTIARQVQTPLLGAGYRSQISNRAAADILLLYNFQDDYNSIYPNPVIRFNFLFNIGR